MLKGEEKASVPERERRLDYRIYSSPSLAALLRVAYETKLSGTVRRSKAQVKALSAYSRSMTSDALNEETLVK